MYRTIDTPTPDVQRSSCSRWWPLPFTSNSYVQFLCGIWSVNLSQYVWPTITQRQLLSWLRRLGTNYSSLSPANISPAWRCLHLGARRYATSRVLSPCPKTSFGRPWNNTRYRNSGSLMHIYYLTSQARLLCLLLPLGKHLAFPLQLVKKRKRIKSN